MSYKLFFSDIDDTLVKLNTDLVPNEVIDDLKKIISSGISFIPCTGRPLSLIPNDFVNLGIDYAIIANGGGIYSYKENKYIFESYIESELSYKLVKMVEKFNGVIAAFYDGGLICDSIYENEITNDPKYVFLRNPKRIDNFHERINDEGIRIQKWVIVTTPENKAEYTRLIKESFDELYVTSFNDISIEITAKGADKGTALKTLANRLNVSLDECIYSGDNDNDIPALEVAGLSIAVGNATNNAKEVADVVSDTYINNGVLKEVLKQI